MRHVRAEEFSDIRSYATEFVVREIMMFGKSPEQTAIQRDERLMGEHFGESIRMLADELGFDLDDEVQADHQWAVATSPIDTPVGVMSRERWRRSDSRGPRTVDGGRRASPSRSTG